MDIAGFAGFAERGPLPPDATDANFDATTVAIHLTGWDQYRATFGGFTDYGYLPYAVRAFFANGGTDCYVARVAATTSADPAQRPSTSIFPVPMTAAPNLALAAAAAAGDITVKVNPAGGAAALNLLAFTTQGLNEYIPVLGADPDGTTYLALPLQAAYPVNTVVGKYQRAFLVSAASAGNWGNRISVEFVPLLPGSQVPQFALRVKVAPGVDLTAPEEEEYYPQLSLDPASSAFAPTVVNAASQLITIDATGANAATVLLVGSGPVAAGAIYLSGGRDGLSALTLRDYIGGQADYRGLALFQRIDDIGILCAPDAVWPGPPPPPPSPQPPVVDPCVKTAGLLPSPPPTPDPTAIPPAMDPGAIYSAMIGQCGLMQYRTAILDLPEGTSPLQAAAWAPGEGLTGTYSRFAAVYYPWIEIPDPLSPYLVTRAIPACGHVAGAYATTDHTEGVQKPPANVALTFATDTAWDITDLIQGPLNQAAVNAIRVIPGRSIRVWGARSLAATDPSQLDWMYIHVRRLMSAIEATLQRSSRWVVFQPNNATLRRTLTHALNVLLESIRQSGGLAGTTAANSYFVKCDDTNNPPAVVDQGQLICQIGVAVADAAEFLVFELRQDVAGATVVEG
jgi:hypothetical protein